MKEGVEDRVCLSFSKIHNVSDDGSFKDWFKNQGIALTIQEGLGWGVEVVCQGSKLSYVGGVGASGGGGVRYVMRRIKISKWFRLRGDGDRLD